MLSRRIFLQSLMLAGGFTMTGLGRTGWALAAPTNTDRRLIVILMRGAVDGLSIVTPYTEPNYYNSRPTIALPPPNQSEGLLYLDGFFGLHSSLAPLMPLWKNRTMAFIQASGSPAETRSHFEAQDILETALLNSAAARQGWMNGLAQILPDNHAATRALSFGNVLPKIFQGRYDVTTVPNNLRPNNNGRPDENPRLAAELSQMYGTQSELGGLYKQATEARSSMMQDLQNEMETAGKGAPGADAFVTQSEKAAAMIHHDPRIQLVFLDVGGWDTHVGQGNAKGQLSNRLERFGAGLAALTQGLGSEYSNTAILILSEFGRTVKQNGNNGTDHGHGNVVWLMGGGVKGGKIYARWPGLNPEQLWQGRDLAVTTDFRSIIGSVIGGQFGVNEANLQHIIPDYRHDQMLAGIVG